MLISRLLPPKQPRRPSLDPANADIDQTAAPAKLTAVVVEDDFLSLLETENVAQEAGLEVVATAVNANEALKVIEEHLPDLVLMDINLGSDRDGIDVALDVNKRFGIRCLFTTAYSDDALKLRADPCQPLGWVTKPFSSDTLRDAIADATDRLKPGN